MAFSLHRKEEGKDEILISTYSFFPTFPIFIKFIFQVNNSEETEQKWLLVCLPSLKLYQKRVHHAINIHINYAPIALKTIGVITVK